MQETARSSPRPRKSFPFHLLVFLVPAALIYTAFMVYPLLDSLRMSLLSDSPDGDVFVGLSNYVTLLTGELQSARFWNALRNNIVFFLIHTLVQNPIGLLLAALLSNKRLFARGAYRTVFFLPTMLSVVLVGFIWQLILSPLWGIAKGFLGVLGLQSLFRPWLGLESSALIVLSLISVWQFVGIPMMLFYTALIAIPDELIEAATVDGSSQWQIFWRIKFPLILPVIGIVEILTFVGNFNAFDLIYVVAGALASPNFSTDIMGTLFFRTFFGQQLQLGNPTMGATVAGMMFLIILTGVLFYMFAWARRVTTYEM